MSYRDLRTAPSHFTDDHYIAWMHMRDLKAVKNKMYRGLIGDFEEPLLEARPPLAQRERWYNNFYDTSLRAWAVADWVPKYTVNAGRSWIPPGPQLGRRELVPLFPKGSKHEPGLRQIIFKDLEPLWLVEFYGILLDVDDIGLFVAPFEATALLGNFGLPNDVLKTQYSLTDPKTSYLSAGLSYED